MLSAIPLSQFRYAHCLLPLGRGAFRHRAKHSAKLKFIHIFLALINLIFQDIQDPDSQSSYKVSLHLRQYKVYRFRK